MTKIFILKQKSFLRKGLGINAVCPHALKLQLGLVQKKAKRLVLEWPVIFIAVVKLVQEDKVTSHQNN